MQSSEYSPKTLEERILKYVREQFLESVFTEETFDDYRSGLVARKKKGFRDMNEESEYLYNSMGLLTQDPNSSV